MFSVNNSFVEVGEELWWRWHNYFVRTFFGRLPSVWKSFGGIILLFGILVGDIFRRGEIYLAINKTNFYVFRKKILRVLLTTKCVALSDNFPLNRRKIIASMWFFSRSFVVTMTRSYFVRTNGDCILCLLMQRMSHDLHVFSRSFQNCDTNIFCEFKFPGECILCGMWDFLT